MISPSSTGVRESARVVTDWSPVLASSTRSTSARAAATSDRLLTGAATAARRTVPLGPAIRSMTLAVQAPSVAGDWLRGTST